MECLVLLHFISKKEVFGIQVFRSVDTDTTTPPEEVVHLPDLCLFLLMRLSLGPARLPTERLLATQFGVLCLFYSKLANAANANCPLWCFVYIPSAGIHFLCVFTKERSTRAWRQLRTSHWFRRMQQRFQALKEQSAQK